MKNPGNKSVLPTAIDLPMDVDHPIHPLAYIVQPVFQVIAVLMLIVHLHFLLAALLYPTGFCRYQTEDSETPSEMSTTHSLWSQIMGIILLSLHLIGIIAIFTRTDLIAFAKVFFINICWILTLSIAIILNHQKSIGFLLDAVEEEVSQTRDESVMLIRAAQIGLQSLRKKIHGQEAVDHFSSASELFKSVGPLALMFINKEKSLMRWGMAAVGLAGKGFKIAQSLLKKN